MFCIFEVSLIGIIFQGQSLNALFPDFSSADDSDDDGKAKKKKSRASKTFNGIFHVLIKSFDSTNFNEIFNCRFCLVCASIVFSYVLETPFYPLILHKK